jgi:molecular chaperone GrpE
MKEDVLEQQTDVVGSQEQETESSSNGATIESLAAERDQLVDQLKRSVAEFQNYRRRNEQDRLRMREIATQDVIRSIIPLIDDLHRAIANIPDDERLTGLSEGLSAIERKFMGVLERNGVASYGAIGDAFDPALHEAVATDETGDRTTVVEVYQIGYRQGDLVLRPAMVKVGGEVKFDA